MVAAHQWYEERTPGLGRRFGEALDAVIERVACAPAQFPRVHGDMRRAVLAQFPYAVYFRESPDHIVVLAVHGRQHPRRWQART